MQIKIYARGWSKKIDHTKSVELRHRSQELSQKYGRSCQEGLINLYKRWGKQTVEYNKKRTNLSFC